jgi:citrate lyase beta subunit
MMTMILAAAVAKVAAITTMMTIINNEPGFARLF